MKLYRLPLALTVINLTLLIVLLAQFHPVSAQDVVPVLRGRALEIVDDQGRVRASITRYVDEGGYPEVVVFRLHDRAGKPTVKLDTHEAGGSITKGSGLGLLGDSDDTQAFIGTEGAIATTRLKNRDGRQRQLQP
jgi:hypothetical protein